MKDVSESLAGRVGILNLLVLREIKDIEVTESFIPIVNYLIKRKI